MNLFQMVLGFISKCELLWSHTFDISFLLMLNTLMLANYILRNWLLDGVMFFESYLDKFAGSKDDILR